MLAMSSPPPGGSTSFGFIDPPLSLRAESDQGCSHRRSQHVTLCVLEMSDQCARVVVLPPPSRRVPREILIELHQDIDEFTPNWRGSQQLRQLRKMDEPVRVPGGPVGIHPVGDPVNLMMGLAGLVQEFGDLPLDVTHGHTSFPSNPFS